MRVAMSNMSEWTVHQEAIVIAVLNNSGKLVMESIVESKASSILQFIHGLQGELHVTWEEGNWAAWLYDLLKHVCPKSWSAIRGAWTSKFSSGVDGLVK